MMAGVNTYAGEKYVCQQFDYQTKTLSGHTIVLTQTGKGILQEEVEMEFTLELFWQTEWRPKLEVEGVVLTEDVMVTFKSNDGETPRELYLSISILMLP